MKGNQQKMREALVLIADEAEVIEAYFKRENAPQFLITSVSNIINLAREYCQSLSAPARNCDRFDTGDVKQDAQNAMLAILDEGVAGYRGIAEYLLSPVCTKGEDDGRQSEVGMKSRRKK